MPRFLKTIAQRALQTRRILKRAWARRSLTISTLFLGYTAPSCDNAGLRRSPSVMSLLAALIFFAVALSVKASPADKEFASAERLTATGAFADSVGHWKKADKLFEQAKNSSGQVETEIRLAAAYHALGQTRLAVDTLTHAQEIAAPADLKHRAQIKAALGAIYTLAAPPVKEHTIHEHMSEHEDMAEATLKESIKLARAAKDPRVEAVALNSWTSCGLARDELGPLKK
jgi:tetratricopeptide (TPR) repeat protein